MKKIENYDKVQASSDMERLQPGGYVVRITEVEDVADKEYLNIVYDIAEGKEKGRFTGEWGDAHKYAHRFMRSYKDKAIGMFKAFTNAVEESNPGYKFDFNEKKLVGKLVGIVLGEEEYQNDFGDIKTRLAVKYVKNVEEIRLNNFTIPLIKKVKVETANAAPEGFAPMDDDCPF